jgi:hypothetical protein
MEQEFMNEMTSVLIIGIFSISILLSYELFYFIGKKHKQRTDYDLFSQTVAIQTGILGLLSLILGFTFNMSIQRFDDRSQAVIKVADAIEEAMLKARLLPEPYDTMTYNLISKYLDLRIEISSLNLSQTEERKSLNKKSDEIIVKLWENSVQLSRIDTIDFTAEYFIESVNLILDATKERNASMGRNVPEVIRIVLLIVCIIGGALMGYTSGLGLKRVYVPTVIFSILIVIVAFIIIDLDRPNRGLIKVNLNPLIELKK